MYSIAANIEHLCIYDVTCFKRCLWPLYHIKQKFNKSHNVIKEDHVETEELT